VEAPLGDGVERKDALGFLLGRVHDALAALPEGPREAFVMFRFEGMPVSQIAEVTGAPPKTVESRIPRATQLLAENLGALREHLPTP
jgi:DNA-directed RNA polymerase specialized sigma24 family protein